MKVMTARDVKNRFGEFLDSAQREPVLVTRNNRPVGIMISVEDAAESLASHIETGEKEPGYDAWLVAKVTRSLRRIDEGDGELLEHDEAMRRLKARLAARFAPVAS
jgi:prevent-host-death family protein